MIKAIETRYKGYRFRSRLEARWAVFFDHVGWNWKYEHQGYTIGWADECSQRNWLPDFEVEIPLNYGMSNRFYVEVKGDKDFFKDGEFCDFLDFGGGPPMFADSFPAVQSGKREFYSGQSMPIVILGDIPRDAWGRLFVPVLTHEKGVNLVWCLADSNGLEGRTSRLLWGSFQQAEQVEYNVQRGFSDFQPKIIPTVLANKRVMEGLSVARSARFEHGESPVVARQ
jgi:hypothetical protein